jgi:ribulose bisphosphate carboxylase small subunit
MLYHVRFDFGRNIQASSKEEAVQKMCGVMRDHPDTFIRDGIDASLKTGSSELSVWGS